MKKENFDQYCQHAVLHGMYCVLLNQLSREVLKSKASKSKKECRDEPNPMQKFTIAAFVDFVFSVCADSDMSFTSSDKLMLSFVRSGVVAKWCSDYKADEQSAKLEWLSSFFCDSCSGLVLDMHLSDSRLEV